MQGGNQAMWRMNNVVWLGESFAVLCPPHDWRSPLVAKLDPDHLTWTCARCGAIATTDDSVSPPSSPSAPR
jgi:hypothetical protein